MKESKRNVRHAYDNGHIWKNSAIFVIAVTLVVTSAAQSRYTVTDLGTLGGSQSNALAINSLGEVTGWANTEGDSELHAFLYSSGTMTDLGAIGEHSVGTAINDSGQVIGIAYSAFSRAWAVWFTEGEMVELDVGGISSYAYAINNSGEVVLCSEGNPAGEGFLYDLASAHFISLTPQIGALGCAVDINNLGEMTGGYRDSEGAHGFLFSAPTLTEIGRLGGDAWGKYSWGNAINDSAQVVGSYLLVVDIYGNMVGRAFLYSGGTSVDIGALKGGVAEAWAINSLGQIVGESTIKPHHVPARPEGITAGDFVQKLLERPSKRWGSGVHAFLYTPDGKMIDLNRFIPANQGWILTSARGINDQGQIIATGEREDVMHAFLLSPLRP